MGCGVSTHTGVADGEATRRLSLSAGPENGNTVLGVRGAEASLPDMEECTLSISTAAEADASATTSIFGDGTPATMPNTSPPPSTANARRSSCGADSADSVTKLRHYHDFQHVVVDELDDAQRADVVASTAAVLQSPPCKGLRPHMADLPPLPLPCATTYRGRLAAPEERCGSPRPKACNTDNAPQSWLHRYELQHVIGAGKVYSRDRTLGVPPAVRSSLRCRQQRCCRSLACVWDNGWSLCRSQRHHLLCAGRKH